jgi:hypothetical protein
MASLLDCLKIGYTTLVIPAKAGIRRSTTPTDAMLDPDLGRGDEWVDEVSLKFFRMPT